MIKKQKFRISELIDFLESVKSEKGDALIFYKNLPLLYYAFLTGSKKSTIDILMDEFENIPKIFYEKKEFKNEK